MIIRAKDKEPGHTEVVFSWLPRAVQVRMSDEEGYNRPSRRYIVWLSYIERKVVGRSTWGLYREYEYIYSLPGLENTL